MHSVNTAERNFGPLSTAWLFFIQLGEKKKIFPCFLNSALADMFFKSHSSVQKTKCPSSFFTAQDRRLLRESQLPAS